MARNSHQNQRVLYGGTADGDSAIWLEHLTDEQYAGVATAITEAG
jgi:hypothetical protein